jgi:hypothetical protein
VTNTQLIIVLIHYLITAVKVLQHKPKAKLCVDKLWGKTEQEILTDGEG